MMCFNKNEAFQQNENLKEISRHKKIKNGKVKKQASTFRQIKSFPCVARTENFSCKHEAFCKKLLTSLAPNFFR